MGLAASQVLNDGCNRGSDWLVRTLTQGSEKADGTYKRKSKAFGRWSANSPCVEFAQLSLCSIRLTLHCIPRVRPVYSTGRARHHGSGKYM